MGPQRRLWRTSAHLAPAGGARRTHEPGNVPDHRASQEWCERVTSLHELVPLAKAQMQKQDWEFMRGGSDSETTIKRNRAEIERLALRPKMLLDVSCIDVSSTLFGRQLAMPVITAPM